MFGQARRGGLAPLVVHNLPHGFAARSQNQANLQKAERILFLGCAKEGAMEVSMNRAAGQLPRRFAVGATYVVEGYGGEEGQLRVIARYVVLPGGRRINVPTEVCTAAALRVLALRRRASAKQSRLNRLLRSGKKFSARRETG
jgi:hypothetical protein